MNHQPDNQDGDVQYIATQEFVRTLHSGMGELPSNILDLLDDHYDFLIDPNVDTPGYQGIGHRAEQGFLWEYRQNRRAITADARRLERGNHHAQTTKNGHIPFYLIAMALRRSPEGKRRVVLCNDPALIEWLHFYGIQTMDSAVFIEKMGKDRLIRQDRAGITPHDITNSGAGLNVDL